MGILVIAEHDNATLKPATGSAIGAARKIGGPISVLVAGHDAAAVAAEAAKYPGIAEVLLADDPLYAHR
ncbi:MAG: electron transfer flavoprotein subunit alpha/FixB family protein, partial [Acetobacteraceae bacterium]|nr:electron transfer flavoprotein subunit alpha/FixB family protein [Acetobacteraceae bacterium]